MIEFKHGRTRLVILTNKYAIKVPWIGSIFRGLIANKSESFTYNKVKESGSEMSELLCPVLFSLWGFIVIMPRVDMNITEKEASDTWDKYVVKNPFLHLLLEPLVKNFGRYKDKIVVIDYNVRPF